MNAAGATGSSAAAMYPSMSVNVSMNMTMHGYGATDAAMPMQCSQVSYKYILHLILSILIASLTIYFYFRCSGHPQTPPRALMYYIHHY